MFKVFPHPCFAFWGNTERACIPQASESHLMDWIGGLQADVDIVL